MGLLKKIVNAVTSAIPALLTGNIPGAITAAGLSFLSSDEDDGLGSFASNFRPFAQALSPGMSASGFQFNPSSALSFLR